jgi:hypothetical protein
LDAADLSALKSPHGHKKKRHGKEHGYKPLKIPFDKDEAMDHGQSRKVGVEMILPEDKVRYCLCCGYQIQRQEIPFNCDLKELGFLYSLLPSTL